MSKSRIRNEIADAVMVAWRRCNCSLADAGGCISASDLSNALSGISNNCRNSHRWLLGRACLLALGTRSLNPGFSISEQAVITM